MTRMRVATFSGASWRALRTLRKVNDTAEIGREVRTVVGGDQRVYIRSGVE